MSRWKACIGLEIHAQLQCTSKLFSPGIAKLLLPNSSVHLFDASIPGTLPQLNSKAVHQAIRAALALNCHIHHTSLFDRKHYFYQDLPLGYQITQQRLPIASRGKLSYAYHQKLPTTSSDDPKETQASNIISKIQKSYSSMIHDHVTVDRLQIEQDSGKSHHDSHPNMSLVDLNRAGMALIEVVFAPELSSPYQAAGVLMTIQELFRHLEICNGNMEDGSLRCDVNVSVSSSDAVKTNRVEIKNLNSIQRLIAASSYEINRQINLLESGHDIIQETRGYDVDQHITYRLRSKEVATDYRYLPDPDLPPLYVAPEDVDMIRQQLPELPQDIINRYLSIGLDDERIQFLLGRTAAKIYYDQVWMSLQDMLAKDHLTPSSSSSASSTSLSYMVYQWIAAELLGYLNSWELSYADSPISPSQLAQLLYTLHHHHINHTQAKMILSRLFYGMKDHPDEQHSVQSIGASLGFIAFTSSDLSDTCLDEFHQSDDEIIMSLCMDSIDDVKNSSNLDKYRKGQHGLINFFLGDIMKRSKGLYDPKSIRNILIEALKHDDKDVKK